MIPTEATDNDSAVILLLRHAETDLNRMGALRGRLDVSLTTKGQAQAERLAQRIADDYAVTAVYTSPLRRAVETAAIIKAATGASIQTHSGFIDVDYGRWAGQQPGSLPVSDQIEVDRWRRDPSVPLSGAEHPVDVQQRALAALEEIRAGGLLCAAVVAHDAVIQLLLCQLLGLPLTTYQGIGQREATLNEVRWEGGQWRVHLLNSSWHLACYGHRRGAGGPGPRDVRIVESSAGGVVLFDGRILLLQTMGGEWILPKGKLKSGESPAQAATREVWEEAGVRAEVVSSLGPTSYRRDLGAKPVDKTVRWFLMRASDEAATVSVREFMAADWKTPQEAMQTLRLDEQRELVSRLAAAASYRLVEGGGR